MPHQQRTLQGQTDVFGDLAGPILNGLQVAELRAQLLDVAIQPGVLPGALAELVEEHLDALRTSCHGAQRVQCADVAGSFPDAHQRSLPVQPRHAGLLDIAVAAQAFHGFGGMRCRPLAHPVLAGGQADPAQQGLGLVAAHGTVGGAGHAHRDHGGGLGLNGQVGQHVAHQWLIDQILTKCLAVLGMVDGLGESGAHAGCAAQRAVQPGEVDHLDDGRNTAPLFADQPCGGAVVLDLTGRVGVVAELVLEPLQPHPVETAVGQHAGQEETGQPARRLGQHQEDVTHRRRGEPLVAGQPVGAVAIGNGLGVAGANVGAALLFGHRHASGDPDFGCRKLQFGVVHATGQQRLVDVGQLGVGPQCRDDRVGHRDGAYVAGLGGPHAGLGGTHHVRTRAVVSPRRGMQSVFDRHSHQLVIGGVELDLIDAVAESIVSAQDRPVALSQLAPALRLPGAGDRADRGHVVQTPLPALADQRLDENRRRSRVVLLQRRHLVTDDMGIWHAANITFFLQPHKRCNAQR